MEKVTDQRLLTFMSKYHLSGEGFKELLGIVNDARSNGVAYSSGGATEGEAIAAMIRQGTAKALDERHKANVDKLAKSI